MCSHDFPALQSVYCLSYLAAILSTLKRSFPSAQIRADHEFWVYPCTVDLLIMHELIMHTSS